MSVNRNVTAGPTGRDATIAQCGRRATGVNRCPLARGWGRASGRDEALVPVDRGRHVVERVDVDPDDVSRRIRGERPQALEQRVLSVDPPGQQELPDEALVLEDEAAGVADADPGADREELRDLGHARDPD